MVTSPYTDALAKYISMHVAKVEPAVVFDGILRRFSKPSRVGLQFWVIIIGSLNNVFLMSQL